MAQFYSLEEAARVLGMSPEELKIKAQQREVRAFLDGGSWRFRRADVDELARRRGMGSDPDLSLSDLDLEVPAGSDSDQELNLSEFQLGTSAPDVSPRSVEIKGGSSDQDVLLDDMSLPPGPATGSSSTILGMKPAGKQPSDSDVRVVPNEQSIKGASDSDVRLAPAPGSRPVPPTKTQPHILPSDSDVKIVPEGVSGISQDVVPADDPAATTLRKSPIFDSSDEVPAAGKGNGAGSQFDVSDSDFELTPSSVIDALQPESGSDFELTALDQSDEFESTPKRGPGDSDVTGAEPSSSGINLGRPSDSGINLQSMGSLDLGDSIELAPLDEDEARPAKPSKPSAKPAKTPVPKKPAAAPIEQPADPSATALPIRPGGEKDIFEDTDFEVDALDSGGEDRTVQLEAHSDFEIDESESASEVFALDEDDVDQNAATAMGPAQLDEDEEYSEEGISGETDSAWGDVSGEEIAATPSQASARSSAASPMLSREASPDWKTLDISLVCVTAVFVLLTAFVGMDLVANLYEFRGSTNFVGSGLISKIADMLP